MFAYHPRLADVHRSLRKLFRLNRVYIESERRRRNLGSRQAALTRRRRAVDAGSNTCRCRVSLFRLRPVQLRVADTRVFPWPTCLRLSARRSRCQYDVERGRNISLTVSGNNVPPVIIV
ncbi:hypothetical protein EVAR_66676_1 [Eumeta japonica]|uniref:Uncharacterized protein n=1 Tax=Eumeta variegata TaxID=151549 RepID=A0A4C1ZJH9_EUMVA|nr:hypothetical protein EVAR_66676_1 [Eumeta japonica]